MGVVRLPVEGHEHVKLIAVAQDWGRGNAGLREGGASHDLRGECHEGLDVIAHLGGYLGKQLGRGYETASTLTGEPDHKVVIAHMLSPVLLGCWARRLGMRRGMGPRLAN